MAKYTQEDLERSRDFLRRYANGGPYMEGVAELIAEERERVIGLCETNRRREDAELMAYAKETGRAEERERAAKICEEARAFGSAYTIRHGGGS